MTYTVTVLGPTTSKKFYMSLAQAHHGAKLRAYEILAGFAKLDTIAAHETMRRLNDSYDLLESKTAKCVDTIVSNTGCTIKLARSAKMEPGGRP